MEGRIHPKGGSHRLPQLSPYLVSSDREQRIVADLFPLALRRGEKLDLEDLQKNSELRTKYNEIPLKVPLKRKIFFSFFLLSRTYRTPLQKRFWPKIIYCYIFALQNVAFSASERRMLLTVKRSRDRFL